MRRRGEGKGGDIYESNAAETASRRNKPFEKPSIVEGAGRNRATILRVYTRAGVTDRTLSRQDDAGTNAAGNDRLGTGNIVTWHREIVLPLVRERIELVVEVVDTAARGVCGQRVTTRSASRCGEDR